ncbi:phosphotransferase [Sphingomonas histidinilytica]|uniref:Ser/Thr protein kinase RdoA involved in Cpx stress response, MazF antagonist n=1 Tax=Rhizorhabdus histidinilytica TaxID=439228 RepID=A0A1T5CUT6_9SPHN|nr:phosphotransferase [Rhizorhabdus histidinilytica]MBO9379144.1 phosphotransferase [Rhizorhabdus histidinilytica]QEH79053.1 phosphotransferase [Sphingomonas sp. C8-2]SKB63219.1 Ser/Thr protein kinase RdoA involved in Cpx stress response, MazF antagonist [Rhizorhabdus histidinilytica]
MSDFYRLSDEEQAVRLTELARVALQRWPGDYSAVTLIKYRENAVFSALGSDGRKVAVRVHRHAYHSDDALRSELQWMQALGRDGIEVPPIIPTSDGEIFATVAASGVPEPRQVDVLGWMTGVPAGSSEEGLEADEDGAERLFFGAGALAARMHEQVKAMAFPEGFTRHAWDDEGLIGADPFWGRFWELEQLTAEQHDLLQQARASAREDLAAFGKHADNYGLIHADFVPENLLVEDGRLKLIDFDDGGYGWHMFDLATALYFNLDHPAYDRMERALFEGYRSVRALPETDGALLPLFMFLRSTTYLGWVQTRSETQTAKELGPMLIERACLVARRYLDDRARAGAAA